MNTSVLKMIGVFSLTVGLVAPKANALTTQVPNTNSVTVTSKLIDSQGKPWTQDVYAVVVISQGAKSESQSTTLTPLPTGYVEYTFSVDNALVSNGGIETVFSAKPGVVSPNSVEDFFLEPEDGLACFHKESKPTYVSSSDSYRRDYKESSLSMPPLYGTINVTQQHGQQLSLSLFDFDPKSAKFSGFYHSLAPAQSFPSNATSVDVYRWNITGASEFSINGPKGAALVSGLLRRGGVASVPLISKEISVNVSVHESQHPTAFRLLLVHEAEHQPNSSVSSGSDVSYSVQSARAVGGMPLKAYIPTTTVGVEIVDHSFGTGDYVLELWGVDITSADTGSFILLDYADLETPQTDQTIVFD